jgi:transketolase
MAINALAPALPEFVGGSADLTGSNLTNWTGCKAMSPASTTATTSPTACASSAWPHIMNGMALHGGLLPFGGTFLMFSEYARNALRMSALMKQRVIYVFTHDSIGLGEDGPTHQPVEQTATLRMIPNMDVWRPCDTVETMVAWTSGGGKADRPDLPVRCRARTCPSCRATRHDRQHCPRRLHHLRGEERQAQGGHHRHRLRSRAGAEGTGERWKPRGVAVRVVSMPSTNVFDRQDAAYRERCCPRACRASPSKPASPTAGTSTSASTARASASTASANRPPPAALFKEFGFTVETS